LVDTHRVIHHVFSACRIYVYLDSIFAGGEVKEDAGICGRSDGLGIHDLPGTIFVDAYNCGTTFWDRSAGSVIYAEAGCGSRKGISSTVAGGGHVLKYLLRILAGAGEVLRQAIVRGDERGYEHHYHRRQQHVKPIHSTPPLVYVELVLLIFSKTRECRYLPSNARHHRRN
jgi:hypothetical protein